MSADGSRLLEWRGRDGRYALRSTDDRVVFQGQTKRETDGALSPDARSLLSVEPHGPANDGDAAYAAYAAELDLVMGREFRYPCPHLTHAG